MAILKVRALADLNQAIASLQTWQRESKYPQTISLVHEMREFLHEAAEM